MEADWEFELGGDAEAPAIPVIDAPWPGFVDLRSSPELAWQLPETAQFPALAEVLIRLNDVSSPAWTSKCDVWPQLQRDEFDPDELDAPLGCIIAMGCYIDLLHRDNQQWAVPGKAAETCKNVCSLLHEVPMQCCRVDLVIRRACITPALTGLGITAYFTSCGGSDAEAAVTLQAALTAFAGALCGHSTIE